jgi:hypothetical protein
MPAPRFVGRDGIVPQAREGNCSEKKAIAATVIARPPDQWL